MNPTSTLDSINNAMKTGIIGSSGQPIPTQVSPTPAVLPPIQETVKTTPTVATSETARNNVARNTTYLDTAEKVAKSNADFAAAERLRLQQEAAKKAETQAKSKTGEDTYSAVASLGGVDLADAKVKKVKGATAAEAKLAQKEANIRKVQSQMDALQKNMDARTAATIENIKTEYAGLIDEQKQANEAYQKGVYTAGLVSGRDQYAPEIQAGITTQAVTYGLKQIEKIQSKRQQLINEAEAARDEMNYKLLSAKMEAIRNNYKDEQQLALTLAEETRKATEADRKNIEYTSKQLAPTIASALTGDDAKDAEIINTLASQYEVPATSLYQYVDEYKREQEKALPNEIAEYQQALKLGYISPNTSFNQYRQSGFKQDTGGGGKRITPQQSVVLKNRDLENVPLADIIDSSVTKSGKFVDVPPSWFVDSITADLGRTPTAPEAKEKWVEFQEDPYFRKVIFGDAEEVGPFGN